MYVFIYNFHWSLIHFPILLCHACMHSWKAGPAWQCSSWPRTVECSGHCEHVHCHGEAATGRPATTLASSHALNEANAPVSKRLWLWDCRGSQKKPSRSAGKHGREGWESVLDFRGTFYRKFVTSPCCSKTCNYPLKPSKVLTTITLGFKF